MDKEISLCVCGKIVGTQRPRFSRRKTKAGKVFINTYTPKATKDYETLIADEYKRVYGKYKFPDEPLEMEAYFYFKMPKSLSQKKRVEMFNTPCCKKPDLDNCIKSVQDALIGVAFTDDSQITDCGHSCKRWGNDEYTIIKIRRVLRGRC